MHSILCHFTTTSDYFSYLLLISELKYLLLSFVLKNQNNFPHSGTEKRKQNHKSIVLV